MTPRPPGILCVDWIPAAPGVKTCHEYAGHGACNLPSRGVCEEWLRKNPNSTLAKLIPQSRLTDGPAMISAATAKNIHWPTVTSSEWPTRKDIPALLASAPTPTNISSPTSPSTLPQGALSVAAANDDPHNPAPLALVPSTAKPLSKAAQRAKDAMSELMGTGAIIVPLPPTLPTDASAEDPFGEMFEKRLAELEALVEEVILKTDHGDVALVRRRTPAATRRELTFREMALLTTVCAVFPGARIVQFHDKVSGAIYETQAELTVRPVSPEPVPPRPLLPACPKCGASFGVETGQQEIVWCVGCNTYQNCRVPVSELLDRPFESFPPVQDEDLVDGPVEDWMS